MIDTTDSTDSSVKGSTCSQGTANRRMKLTTGGVDCVDRWALLPGMVLETSTSSGAV